MNLSDTFMELHNRAYQTAVGEPTKNWWITESEKMGNEAYRLVAIFIQNAYLTHDRHMVMWEITKLTETEWDLIKLEKVNENTDECWVAGQWLSDLDAMYKMAHELPEHRFHRRDAERKELIGDIEGFGHGMYTDSAGIRLALKALLFLLQKDEGG